MISNIQNLSEKEKEIFKLNLDTNKKRTLQKWLYGECLELGAALVAFDLQPTEQHLKELYEEIADVKVLLTQYFLFHDVNPGVCAQGVPVDSNAQLANMFAAHGYLCGHGINSPSANVLSQGLMQLSLNKYPSPEINKIYHEKIEKLGRRLESGEFT